MIHSCRSWPRAALVAFLAVTTEAACFHRFPLPANDHGPDGASEGGTGAMTGEPVGTAGAMGASPEAADAGAWSACPAPVNPQPLPFVEGFEAYAPGTLLGAAGSPWVRASQGREGNVSTSWVHSGSRSLEIYSFTTATEVHYVPLQMPAAPARIDVEWWIAPDGYFVYKAFATVGFGCARSKFDLRPVLAVEGRDHALILHAGGAEVMLFDEIEYGSAAFPEAEPGQAIHNYVRLEFDFPAGKLRTFVGPNSAAPLRSSVSLPETSSFGAFFVSGGVNPSYIDDLSITLR